MGKKRKEKDVNFCCHRMDDAIRKGYVILAADIAYGIPYVEMDCVWGYMLNFEKSTAEKEIIADGAIKERVYVNYCPWCGLKMHTLVGRILKTGVDK